GRTMRATAVQLQRAVVPVDHLEPGMSVVLLLSGGNGIVELDQPVDRGLPGGDMLIVGGEPGERIAYVAESACRLHQPAKRDRTRKITRCGYQEREDHPELAIATGEPAHLLLALHDRPPVGEDV